MSDISWIDAMGNIEGVQPWMFRPSREIVSAASSAYKSSLSVLRDASLGKISDYKALGKRTYDVVGRFNTFFARMSDDIQRSGRFNWNESSDINRSLFEITKRLGDLQEYRILSRSSADTASAELGYVGKDVMFLREQLEDAKAVPKELTEGVTHLHSSMNDFSRLLKEFKSGKPVLASPVQPAVHGSGISPSKFLLPLAIAPFVLLLVLFNAFPQTGMFVFQPGDSIPSVILLMLVSIIVLFFIFGFRESPSRT